MVLGSRASTHLQRWLNSVCWVWPIRALPPCLCCYLDTRKVLSEQSELVFKVNESFLKCNPPTPFVTTGIVSRCMSGEKGFLLEPTTIKISLFCFSRESNELGQNLHIKVYPNTICFDNMKMGYLWDGKIIKGFRMLASVYKLNLRILQFILNCLSCVWCKYTYT